MSAKAEDAEPPWVVLRRLHAVLSEVRAQHGSDGNSAVPAQELLDALTALRHLRTEMAGWEPELIAAARRAGASWAVLAPALGVTSRQAAERRYLRLRPTEGPESTGEQRVRATRDRRAGDRAVTVWARENSASLRQIAGQVSGLTGLSEAGRRRADRVQAELGGDDAATLLGPLSELREHLVAEHPKLAAKITEITAGADRQRAKTLSRRSSRSAVD